MQVNRAMRLVLQHHAAGVKQI